MSLNKLCQEAHENAIKHGWWEEEKSFGELIALVHSELSEALEEYRLHSQPTEIFYECDNEKCTLNNGVCEASIPAKFKDCQAKPCGIPTELADVLIRIFDMCGHYGIDLDEAVRIKMEYNKLRPWKHGGKKI